MRIVVVFPWPQGGLPEAEEAHRRALATAAASPGTVVDFVQIDRASMFSEPFSQQNTARVVEEMAQTIERAARDTPDAIVVWGGLDPGVALARERVQVPVIGVAQATYAVAAQLGVRLGLVVYEPGIVDAIWAGARACGAERSIASVRSIDVPMPELTPRRDHVRARIVEEAGAALAEDGATAIYVNGMSMMPAAMSAEELMSRVGAPVLDPLRIGLRTAEMIADRVT
ncbi:MAG: aspartate/glutamate racemase family protein [Chloroflexota bacterium]